MERITLSLLCKWSSLKFSSALPSSLFSTPSPQQSFFFAKHEKKTCASSASILAAYGWNGDRPSHRVVAALDGSQHPVVVEGIDVHVREGHAQEHPCKLAVFCGLRLPNTIVG